MLIINWALVMIQRARSTELSRTFINKFYSQLYLCSSYFVKKTTLILQTCSSCWLTTYLLSLVDVFFNRQSAYQWAQAVSLLADLFLYSYEADLIQKLLKKNEKKLARSFNFKFRYTDDVLSLNNSMFCDVVHGIYHNDL